MKNKKSKILSLAIGILMIVALVCGYLAINTSNQEVEQEAEEDYHEVVYNGKTYKYNSKIINILLLGIDTTEDDTSRSDTINMLILDRENKQMKVLAISRDTMCDVHFYDINHNSLGWQNDHLALQYAYGTDPENGCLLTNKAVSRLLHDVPVNYFASMNLSMFADLQNIIGTLDVVVPNDSLVEEHPEWAKGATATLTADNVEEFLRERDCDKDFSNDTRMERQRAYINAYMQKLRSLLGSDFKSMIKKIYKVVQKSTTNITLENVESFASMILTYTYNEDSDYQTLPGENHRGELYDEFIVDKEKLRSLILESFYKEEK